MKTHRTFRAPEGDPQGGGGYTGPTGGDPSAHTSDAAALWPEPGDAPAPSGDGDPPKPDAKPKPDVKPDVKPDAKDKKPADGDPPKKQSIFDKMGKKPDGDAGDVKPDGDPTPKENPEDSMELAKEANPGTKDQFAALKTITKTIRGELSAKDATIAELREKVAKASGGESDDVKRIREEHKAFSERLSALDVQSHPDFRKNFTDPKAKLIEATSAVLKDNEVEGVNIDSLLGKSRSEFAKEVSKIADDLPSFEQQAFISDMRQLFQVEAATKDALAKSGDMAKELSTKSETASREAFESTWKELGGMEDFLVKLEADDSMSPEQKSEVEAFNSAASGVREEAERLMFGTNDDKGVARIATEAATLRFLVSEGIPRMEKEFKESVEIIDSLKAEIAKLKGKKPAPSGGGGGGDFKEKTLGDLDHDSAAKQVWPRG